jgi:hypothetical protein
MLQWTASIAVLALALVGAIVATGYQSQRVQLDDGAVWVTNSDKQAVGRANTRVFELNTVLSTDSAAMDVLQNGSSVFIVNDAKRALDIVDQASGTVSQSVPLPAGVSTAALAGENLVLHAPISGDVWIVPVAGITRFDAKSQQANFSIGADSVIAVNQLGRFVGVSAKTGTVTTVDTRQAAAPQLTTLATKLNAGSLEVTLVGDRWVVLDRSTSTVVTAGRVIDLGGKVGDLTQAKLQVASNAGRNGAAVVLLAHSGGLSQINLDGGDVSALSTSVRGRPAAPYLLGDCTYAAWSGGSVWSQCGGAKENVQTAPSMVGSAVLTFREASQVIALNDGSTGATWSVQNGVRLINNWASLLAQQAAQQKVIQTNQADTPQLEKNQVPPVAVDDNLGARPGRVTSLPVLLNDYDPNGDALVIDSVTPIAASLGEVFVSPERNFVMMRLVPGAAGRATFSYTISDGKGGVATANVAVTVHPDSQNAPPVQMRPTRTTVASGGQVMLNVLGDWVDPDGDAIFVKTATFDGPDSLSYTPAGRLAFTDSGRGGGGSKLVSLDVSDGRASGFGSVQIAVRPAGQVPITAEPFAALAIVGQPVTISPQQHVRGGTGNLSLSGVPNVAGMNIVPNFNDFTFTVTPSRAGSTYLSYALTDGQTTSTGLVRLDVQAAPAASAKPVTASHSVYVPLQQTRTVDVTATDRDPAGGVLVVTGVNGVLPSSGLQVEIVDHRVIRVTLTKPLDAPVSFGYRVSNGVSQSDGTVTVVQTPAPTTAQAPVAVPDNVTVRVGDVISIPVLANDIHPDGGELTLDQHLDQNVPSSAGLLFASGASLRFLAGNNPGTYSAIYRVNADNGQWASGTVTIAVRPIDEATNQPPRPANLTARAMSGQTVRILIPLVGIDPDGDSVQFVGLDTNPEKGSIAAVGPDWIDYEASAYGSGTDSLTYSVVDALGAQATASIRIGIAEPLAGGRNPIATPVEAVARPGYTIYVRPLESASDPDGRPLTVTKVTSQDRAMTAEIIDNVVKIQVPNTVGRYGLVYEISNDLAGTASNFITVDVAAQAALSRPVVGDAVVSLTDILGRDSVDVNVLTNAFFADGPVSSLRPAIVSGYGGSARVISSNTVRVNVLAQSQIIPFQVAHPDDPNVVSYAFIWVPGTDDALPQRKKGVQPLTVVSEQPLRININDFVIAALGKTVKLTSANTVRATHADGGNLVINDTTLTYTSEVRYFGPASISFEVTDGASASASGAHTATIVLPITVTPRENMPPVFLGAAIDLEPGQEKTLDLVRVTRYPYAKNQNELTYTVTPGTDGVSASISGQTLTLKASNDAQRGKTVPLQVTVRDQVNQGSPGQILVSVVPSTRPLPVPASDSVAIKRGEVKTVDVLANDAATNPFPGQPLRVIAVRGINAGNIPAGVTVVPSADKSTLTVSASANANPSDTAIEYQVADVTNDPDRYTWGVVNISVQDVPDAPAAPTRADDFVSGSLTLTWPAPAANNSPITKYVVESNAGYRKDCTATVCVLDGLPTGQRFTFTVTAVNALGSSAKGASSASLSADVVPAAPSSVSVGQAAYDPAHPDGGGITVSWTAVGTPAGGSPVNKYLVDVIEDGAYVRGQFDVPASTTSLGTLWYSAGHTYTARVSARNDAQSTNWNSYTSNPVTAAGVPQAAGVQAPTQTGLNGETTWSWNTVGLNGASSVTYYVKGGTSAFSGGSCPANYTSGATNNGSSTNFTDGSSKTPGDYFYVVYAATGWGCVAQTASITIVQRIPGAASYTSATCLRTDAGHTAEACVGTPIATPAGTPFTIRVVAPTVASLSSSVTYWQMQVGPAGNNVWQTLTAVTGSPGTYELLSTQYFPAGNTAIGSQTVVIRGCTAANICGASGGTASVFIPAPAP